MLRFSRHHLLGDVFGNDRGIFGCGLRLDHGVITLDVMPQDLIHYLDPILDLCVIMNVHGHS